MSDVEKIRSKVDRPKGRVLLVTSNYPRWNGDSTTPFILHLAQDLQKVGWVIEVLAPHAPGALQEDVLGDVKVSRFRYLYPAKWQTLCYGGGALINLRKRKRNLLLLPLLVAAELIATYWLLYRGDFDIVHSHWILPQGFVGSVCHKLLGVPHVMTVHGSDVFALKAGWLGRFKKWSLAHADIVTVNSGATERATMGLCSNDSIIRRIPMGADTRMVQNTTRVEAIRKKFSRGRGPLVAFVGRIVEEKGVDDLIDSIDELTSSLHDITAILVGEGQDKEQFQEEVNRRGLADRIFFIGWVQPENVRDYLAAADIFTGPSKPSREGGVEAQGLTYIEAMMVGTPVIGSRLGGIVDAVIHGETGLLVEPGAPTDLAKAIFTLASQPDLARSLCMKAREFAVENFDRRLIARKFSALFDHLLGKRAGETLEPKGIMRRR